MSKMIMWGATGQAKVLRECMRYHRWELTAIFDNNSEIMPPFNDVPLLIGKESFEEWALQSSKEISEIGYLIAIGGFNGKDRVSLHNYIQSFGLNPLKAIHPTAAVADNVLVENGCQVLMNASVCVDVIMGKCCIINTNASVDHECQLEDGVHICPGAHIAGCVKIGRYSSIGTGAVVLPRLKIGECAIIGAGSVVLRDVEPYTMWVGNPARLLKRLQ